MKLSLKVALRFYFCFKRFIKVEKGIATKIIADIETHQNISQKSNNTAQQTASYYFLIKVFHLSTFKPKVNFTAKYSWSSKTREDEIKKFQELFSTSNGLMNAQCTYSKWQTNVFPEKWKWKTLNIKIMNWIKHKNYIP